jgi:predicted ATPase
MVSAVKRAAATSTAGSMHGFAGALTSFVGRAGLVDEIVGLVGQCRLVTVTGPGGVGKTRLAGEVASQLADEFADGVWLAELAAVRDPAGGGRGGGGTGDPGAALGGCGGCAGAGAGRRQLLLVLDNCEHVIGAAAELSGRLLLGADDVRVLATSREPLRIAGEVRYRLAPLTLPDPANPEHPDGSEAVALFADRARRADASFALDEETRARGGSTGGAAGRDATGD